MKVFVSILSIVLVAQLHLVLGLPTFQNIGEHLGLRSISPDQQIGQVLPYHWFEDGLRQRLEKPLPFDPLTTPINVSGAHAFVPPNFAAGDQRGPCPALNALANHAYLPHNGVVGMLDAIDACNTVLGFALELGTVISTFATAFVGNVISIEPEFSIGGATPGVNILGGGGGLLGTPEGLDGSHNTIEADSSPTRGDLYQIGNNYNLQMANFMELYNLSNDPVGNYSMDIMMKHAQNRYQQSLSQNPYFYFGPVTGFFFRNGAFAFAGRIFRNYSYENPDGVLTKETLKSFYAISGDDGNLKYNAGWERIPQNWYRIPVDYSLASLIPDVVAWTLQDPSFANIGGNTGSVNSFVGVDLGNLTGGVYNAMNLLQGNNLICFSLEVIKFFSPSALSTIYSTIDTALGNLTNALAGPIASLQCPVINSLTVGGKPAWQGLQDLFPGAKKSGRAF